MVRLQNLHSQSNVNTAFFSSSRSFQDIGFGDISTLRKPNSVRHNHNRVSTERRFPDGVSVRISIQDLVAPLRGRIS